MVVCHSSKSELRGKSFAGKRQNIWIHLSYFIFNSGLNLSKNLITFKRSWSRLMKLSLPDHMLFQMSWMIWCLPTRLISHSSVSSKQTRVSDQENRRLTQMYLAWKGLLDNWNLTESNAITWHFTRLVRMLRSLDK